MKLFSTKPSSGSLLYASAAFLAAAAFSFASCTPDRSRILDILPADSRAVAVISTDKLSQQLPADSWGSLKILADGAEDGIVAVVTSSNAAQYSVMIPRNLSQFSSALTDSGYTSVASGDYDVFSRDDSPSLVVARDGSAVWQTYVSSPADFISSQIEAASESPLRSLKGVAEYIFSEPGIVTGAISRRAVSSQIATATDATADTWYCFSADQKDNVLAVDFGVMESSGKPVSIKGVQTLSTDFLRYIPQGQGVVAAVGLTDDVDWDAAAALLSSFAGTDVATYVNALMPYLKAIDGTVAVAVMPKTPSALSAWSNPQDWNLFLMAHMPQAKVNDALNTVSLLANMAGASVSEVSQGVKQISLDGFSFYAGTVDGNLTLSTFTPDGKAQNSLTTVFSGKNGALSANLPASIAFPYPELSDALMDFSIQLEDNGGVITLSFPGASVSPLQVLARAGFARIPGF